MTRPSHLRALKYAGKASGPPSEAYLKVQKAGFTRAAGDQVRIERLVKSILSSQGVMVALNHFYMNFGKKLDKLRRTYTGPALEDEACIEYGKWSSRGLDTTVLDLIVAAFSLPSCAVVPPVCDWLYKRKLTFSGNVSATNLDNFPVLVHLTVANFDFNKAQPAGQDIRFMDSDLCPGDGTPLKHEIEHWDKAGSNAWVWVKVPRIDGGSAADFIYMYYGNGAAPDGQDPANVWDANFKGVWHMKGDGTTSIPDSTGVNNGTKGAIGAPANITENIDGSQQFTGGQIINCGGGASLDITGNLTVEYWIYMPSAQVGTGNHWVLTKGTIAASAQMNYFLIVLADNPNFRFDGRRRPFAELITPSVYNYNTWYHVAFTYDGAGHEIFVNGVSGASDGNVGAANTGDPLCFGKVLDYAFETFRGKMDEVRVSSTDRSQDWLTATYKSGAETLITYGAEEPA